MSENKNTPSDNKPSPSKGETPVIVKPQNIIKVQPKQARETFGLDRIEIRSENGLSGENGVKDH